MKSRSRWKAVEREVAADFGGKRVPITGRARGDVPDIDCPNYSVEVKAGRTALSAAKIRQAQDQARAASVGTGKLPISVHIQSTQGRPAFKVVVIDYDLFIEEYVK